MSGIFHQAGCCCCGGGVPCEFCPGSRTPESMRVIISGGSFCPCNAGNETYDSPSPDINGTFVLPQRTACFYQLILPATGNLLRFPTGDCSGPPNKTSAAVQMFLNLQINTGPSYLFQVIYTFLTALTTGRVAFTMVNKAQSLCCSSDTVSSTSSCSFSHIAFGASATIEGI